MTTVTQTLSVDCGMCMDVVVRNAGGHGPVRPPFSVTVTEAVTTITTYACGGPTLYPGPIPVDQGIVPVR